MSTCRVTKVKAARKSPGICQKCFTTIETGQPYLWWQGRFGPKHVRCASHPPRLWETETNPLKADALKLEDDLASLYLADTASWAASHLTDAIEAAQAIVDALQERTDNMLGTGLENTEQYQTLENTRYEFEGWIGLAEDTERDLSEMPNDPPEEDDEDGLAEYEAKLEEIISNLEDLPELDLGAYGPPRRPRKASS